MTRRKLQKWWTVILLKHAPCIYICCFIAVLDCRLNARSVCYNIYGDSMTLRAVYKREIFIFFWFRWRFGAFWAVRAAFNEHFVFTAVISACITFRLNMVLRQNIFELKTWIYYQREPYKIFKRYCSNRATSSFASSALLTFGISTY